MSKFLDSMEQVKQIRQNKLTEVLEKAHGPVHPEGYHDPHPDEHASVNPPLVRTSVISKILMIAVIALGVIFIGINYKVLTELTSIRESVSGLSRKSGAQNGKVYSIEKTLSILAAENKSLQTDMERRDKVRAVQIDKLQSDMAEADIASGILRTKVSEINLNNKKLFDKYADLSNEIYKIKQEQLQPVTAQQVLGKE